MLAAWSVQRRCFHLMERYWTQRLKPTIASKIEILLRLSQQCSVGRDSNMIAAPSIMLKNHTAQQAQPSAPKKPLRSAIGSLDVQAPAWSWPWTLQELAQPQVEIAVRRRELKPAPCGSPQAA
jgi:hypothetical protein